MAKCDNCNTVMLCVSSGKDRPYIYWCSECGSLKKVIGKAEDIHTPKRQQQV